jgi:hypothetical protein
MEKRPGMAEISLIFGLEWPAENSKEKTGEMHVFSD